jgi:hypothetical protein
MKGHTRWLVIILVALSLMLPRLLSPHFGFFDDANTILVSQRILSGDWNPGMEAGDGRFRPAYWLYSALIYAFAGQNPFWFFLGNAVLLTGIALGFARLAAVLLKDSRYGLVAGVVFLLSGPVVENVYTLSKPELQQAFWITCSLLACGFCAPPAGRLRWWLGVLLSAAALFLACATKEVSLLLGGISAAWLVMALTWGKLRQKYAWAERSSAVYPLGAYLLACLGGCGVFMLARANYLPFGIIERGYASNFMFSMDLLTNHTRLWMDLLLRDYLYIFPLAAAPLLQLIRRRALENLDLLGYAAVWMLVWVGVYIPWQYTLAYYLLPFTLGAVLAAAALLRENLAVLREAQGMLKNPGYSRPGRLWPPFLADSA